MRPIEQQIKELTGLDVKHVEGQFMHKIFLNFKDIEGKEVTFAEILAIEEIFTSTYEIYTLDTYTRYMKLDFIILKFIPKA